jgi:hypothetical protein
MLAFLGNAEPLADNEHLRRGVRLLAPLYYFRFDAATHGPPGQPDHLARRRLRVGGPAAPFIQSRGPPRRHHRADAHPHGP